MPTVHEKLKLAFVHQHPDDGLMLTVTTRGEHKFDMVLTPQTAAMLLGQLTQGVKDALSRLDSLANPKYVENLVEHTSVVAAEKSKPGSLEIQGNDLIMGGQRLRLTKSQAAVAQLLVDNFGKPVRKQQILDHLYGLDPNGGANENIVDVWICKLRGQIADKRLALSIITHHSVGYEMRRPVGG